MINPKVEAAFLDFVEQLDARALAHANRGNYSAAMSFGVASEALAKWVEEGLEGAMASVSEENFEKRVY